MNWIKLVGKIAPGLANKLIGLIPTKMTEEERKVFEHETKMAVEGSLQDNEESFREFILDYEGRAADVPKLVLILRSIIRPGITIFAFAMWCWVIWMKATDPTNVVSLDLMPYVQPVVYITLAFWFGEKLITRSGLVDLLIKKK